MSKGPVEIICSACGEDTFVRREPEYDGFVKKGETFVCASCGHKYESEAVVPFKQKKSMSIFSEADKLKKAEIFNSEEVGKNCRNCRHYVVNPFTQRCGLHKRVVLATDLCDKFEKAEEKEEVISDQLSVIRKQ
jgi:hypothetical protein